AAMGATYYLVLVFVLLFGGIGMAVQTQVAQAYGGRRRVRAAKAVWIGAWAAAFTIPPFVLLALSGHGLLGPFGLSPGIEDLAVEFWLPRMVGGPRGRAAMAAWLGAGPAACTLPPFVLLALSGHGLLGPFGLSPEIEDLAVEYWLPRMLGGPLAVLYWVFTGFFNGIGRTRVTL